MNIRIQIIIAVIIILAFIYITNLVRKKKVELKYTISWYVLGVVYLLFDLIPPFLNGFTRLIGIALPVNMLIFLAIGIIFMILFSQTVIISRHTQDLKKLVQQNALLEERLRKLEEESHEKE
jgi:hypothetical protein